MRRFLLNIGFLAPLIAVGYYALPVLFDPAKGAEYTQTLVQLVKNPHFKTGFYVYMGAMFSIAFVPHVFYSLRNVFIKARLAKVGLKTDAQIISVKNTGVRINHGFYVHMVVRLPGGQEGQMYERVSLVRHFTVGDTVRVLYDPANPSFVCLN